MPNVPFDSREAVSTARCQPAIPQTATLVTVKSDTNGSLDEHGRGLIWTVEFFDEPTDRLHSVYLNEHAEVSDQGAPYTLECQIELVNVDSASVVPDALSRLVQDFGDNDPYDSLFYLQKLDCYFVEAHHLVFARRTTAKSDEWFTVQYDDGGQFTKQCGPCDDQPCEWCDL